MRKDERLLLSEIRNGMVTLVELTTSMLVADRNYANQAAEDTVAERIVQTAEALTEQIVDPDAEDNAKEAAKRMTFRKVAPDGFSSLPEQVPQPIPARATPENPNPPNPRLTDAEKLSNQALSINTMLSELGIQLKAGGTVEINWDQFAVAIGPTQAGELSNILIEMYG